MAWIEDPLRQSLIQSMTLTLYTSMEGERDEEDADKKSEASRC